MLYYPTLPYTTTTYPSVWHTYLYLPFTATVLAIGFSSAVYYYIHTSAFNRLLHTAPLPLGTDRQTEGGGQGDREPGIRPLLTPCPFYLCLMCV